VKFKVRLELGEGGLGRDIVDEDVPVTLTHPSRSQRLEVVLQNAGRRKKEEGRRKKEERRNTRRKKERRRRKPGTRERKKETQIHMLVSCML